MADSNDTRIAPAIPQNPSRRTILAGLAAAPTAAFSVTGNGESQAESETENHAATAEELAVLDFEPMCAEDLKACVPPGNKDGIRLSTAHLPTLRIAWVMMGKTNPELIEMLRRMDDETGVAMMDGFISAIEFFKNAVALLEKAEARILVAGSVLEVEEWPSS